MQVLNFDRSNVQLNYNAKRFHDMARLVSLAQTDAERERAHNAFWGAHHFWWRAVAESAAPHREWLELYRHREREFARWHRDYPVPQNLRVPGRTAAG